MPTNRLHTTLVARRAAMAVVACASLFLASCGTIPRHDESESSSEFDGTRRHSATGTCVSMAVPAVRPASGSGATGAEYPPADADGAESGLCRPVAPRALPPENRAGLALAFGTVRVVDAGERCSPWFYAQHAEDRIDSIYVTYTIEF